MKKQDLTQHTEADLQDRLAQNRDELAKLRFNHSIAGLENPNVLRLKKREIARVMTELTLRKNKAQ